ncbi:hypothetical protein OIU74_020689 [Salix koriyanagi]|uniref:Uncharacterized protein n=1 Tax=Salix koriyanagi TaxID=2511006 RepID=A0A9Q0P6G2_9ROSI|nr:hypothetical protein OIU74_020689 [Salix koriyanagi]
MARISRNHLVLVAFFLLCFVSTCARATRTLRDVNDHEGWTTLQQQRSLQSITETEFFGYWRNHVTLRGF